MILSLSSSYTGILEYFRLISSSIYSDGSSLISIAKTSVRGVMISYARMSSKANTPVIIFLPSSFNSPLSWPASSISTISSSEYSLSFRSALCRNSLRNRIASPAMQTVTGFRMAFNTLMLADVVMTTPSACCMAILRGSISPRAIRKISDTNSTIRNTTT